MGSDDVVRVTNEIDVNETEKSDADHQIVLILDHNPFGSQGCRQLANVTWFNLGRIYLIGNRFGEKGCKYLARGQWKNLQMLILDSNDIGDKGCQQLAKGKWPNLK